MAGRGCFHCSRPPEIVTECLAELADEAADRDPAACFCDAAELSRNTASQNDLGRKRFYSLAVPVPDTAQAGDFFTFQSPDGIAWKQRVPAGKTAGEMLQVKLPAPQKVPVLVPKGRRSGDSFKFVGPDDEIHTAVVPRGVQAGETFDASVYCNPPQQHGLGLEEPELVAWLDAASAFTMNSEFDLASLVGAPIPNLKKLTAQMIGKTDSNFTAQALRDKITLSQLLGNLELPSMPTLLTFTNPKTMVEDVQRFVDHCIACEDKADMVLKPTHLSNGQGVLILRNHVQEDSRDITTQSLQRHFRQFWRQPPEVESTSGLIRAGFLLQPKYEACLGFSAPLELRLVALWGKTRSAVWWWGMLGGPRKTADRNTWILRRPVQLGRFSENDSWEVLHGHSASTPEVLAAHKLLLHHMPVMAKMTEQLGTAVGAPFLRADFFVGSPQWGVRLNSVALESGIEYRRRRRAWGPQADAPLIDDAPAMAQILLRGMKQVQERRPATHFLSKLGVHGDRYEEMRVDVMLPSDALQNPVPSGQAMLEDTSEDHSLLQGHASSAIVPQSAPGIGNLGYNPDGLHDETCNMSSSEASPAATTVCRRLNFHSPNSSEVSAAAASVSSQEVATPRIGGVHCYAHPEVRGRLSQSKTVSRGRFKMSL